MRFRAHPRGSQHGNHLPSCPRARDPRARSRGRPRPPARHPGRRTERRRRRPAHRVASHRQPAGPALRRHLVRARRDHAAALRPEGASPRPRRRGRDVPPRRRVLAHRNCRALTVHAAGACTLRTCAAPAGGWLFRPTRPPRLTTRLAETSNDGRRPHRRPRPSFPRKIRTPGKRRPGPGAKQRPSAGATPAPHSLPPAPIDAFPDEFATADEFAAVRPDADPGATGPHSRAIRGLLGGARAGWKPTGWRRSAPPCTS